MSKPKTASEMVCWLRGLADGMDHAVCAQAPLSVSMREAASIIESLAGQVDYHERLNAERMRAVFAKPAPAPEGGRDGSV